MNDKLILRTLNSPWVTPIDDFTKDSVLTHVELDSNFIYLKGEIISGVTAVDNLITFTKINGEQISFSALTNINDIEITGQTSGGTDTYWVSGSTGINSLKTINNSTTDANGDYAISLGFNNRTNANHSAILGGSGNTIYSNAVNTVLLGVNNVTTNIANTVFVPRLNINNIISDLDYDSLLTIGSSGQVSKTSYSGIVQEIKTEITNTVSGATLWSNEGSGDFSVQAINDSGIDANGDYSLAAGFGTQSEGDFSTAFGHTTVASGLYSFVSGSGTTAGGDFSHAIGFETVASGNNSYAEGSGTRAVGIITHAEGLGTQANGNTSHAEGKFTIANGIDSHAEGGFTTANGNNSHSQNYFTTANGVSSHAGGQGHNTGGRLKSNGLASFVHSRSNTVGDYGVFADDSAILGGLNNKLENNAQRSVILGGSGITGSTADTVYVPKINIKTTSEIVNYDFLLSIDNNGNVNKVPASSISGGGGNIYIEGRDDISVSGTGTEQDPIIIQYDDTLFIPTQREVKFTLTTNQIRNLNSNPIELIPSPGPDKFIEVISAAIRYNYGTVPFNGLGDFSVASSSSASDAALFRLSPTPMQGTNSFFVRMYQKISESGFQLVENDSVVARTEGDSLQGNGTIDLYIIYRIVNI